MPEEMILLSISVICQQMEMKGYFLESSLFVPFGIRPYCGKSVPNAEQKVTGLGPSFFLFSSKKHPHSHLSMETFLGILIFVYF